MIGWSQTMPTNLSRIWKKVLPLVSYLYITRKDRFILHTFSFPLQHAIIQVSSSVESSEEFFFSSFVCCFSMILANLPCMIRVLIDWSFSIYMIWYGHIRVLYYSTSMYRTVLLKYLTSHHPLPPPRTPPTPCTDPRTLPPRPRTPPPPPYP